MGKKSATPLLVNNSFIDISVVYYCYKGKYVTLKQSRGANACQSNGNLKHLLTL